MGLFSRRETEKKHREIPAKWPDHVLTLTVENFDDITDKYPLTFVDFWAPWCGPCKVMLPRLRRLEQIYRKKVVFGRLNTQDYPDFSKRYKIMGIPHFIVFHYGKPVERRSGVISVGNLKDTIERLLKKYQ